MGLVGLVTALVDLNGRMEGRRKTRRILMLLEILQAAVKSFYVRKKDAWNYYPWDYIIITFRSLTKKNMSIEHYKCGSRGKIFFPMIAVNGKTTGHWRARASLFWAHHYHLHVVTISLLPTCQCITSPPYKRLILYHDFKSWAELCGFIMLCMF